MEQFIEAPKKRGRPTAKPAEPKLIEYVATYKVYRGKAFIEEKSLQMHLDNSPTHLLATLEKVEQHQEDLAAEKRVHANVPSFALDDEYDRKRNRMRVVLTGFFKITISMLFVLVAFTAHAETGDPIQFCKKFVDNDGCTAIISYHQHDEVASIYWPELKKAESVKIPLKYVTLNHINYGTYRFHSRTVVTYTAGSNDKQNSSHKTTRKSSQD